MIIKKYKALTEKEAILLAKEDLGPDAIVMNVKKIKPGGIMRLFKKTRVELTAAIDDDMEEQAATAAPMSSSVKSEDEQTIDLRQKRRGESTEEPFLFGKAFGENKDSYSEEAQNAIEEKINSIAKLLEQQVQTQKSAETSIKEAANQVIPSGEVAVRTEEKETEQSGNKVVDLVIKQLIDSEVTEAHAKEIIDELTVKDDKQPIDNILANVYQKIVLKLGEIQPLTAGEKKPKVVFFVGNTGVGKTTTMAKLASLCTLDMKLKCAMFSIDTYRIAAIEQLKTYANILSAPMEVVYTPEEMAQSVEKFKNYDLILVDTAGRSHKSEEQKDDLKQIIDSVKEYETEVFLVVSATVKYADLLSIANTYGELFDYNLIFTKLDETNGLGSILNLKLDTGKPLSYVTWGQNVPDDIGVLDPQIIAKKLLGGGK
ncbi:flagellar biosynthesis protein FlhF [Eubacterium sp. MSJ-21]|nr:flagellar biosynthesis protein FlhF [Eubacterium sp. MSJ-21]